ncbi:hypoxanthine phosphoribosyltransferase [Parelusimicrobium proximum]
MSLHPDVKRVLINQEQLSARIKELGAQITKDYEGKKPLIVGVLRGCVLFYSDLLKEIRTDCTLDFVCLSSYCGTESSGDVRFLLDLRTPLKDRHVIIVEDIVDTGLTLDYLTKNLSSRGAASIAVCTLLDKPANRKSEVDVKYKGFEIENEFVIGYGLDYNELYRNLPYIGVYKQ